MDNRIRLVPIKSHPWQLKLVNFEEQENGDFILYFDINGKGQDCLVGMFPDLVQYEVKGIIDSMFFVTPFFTDKANEYSEEKRQSWIKRDIVIGNIFD